jgi:hypothetical protein
VQELRRGVDVVPQDVRVPAPVRGYPYIRRTDDQAAYSGTPYLAKTCSFLAAFT